MVATTPNLVHADKEKVYCGTVCVTGSNQEAKQNFCEPNALDCHNARQACEVLSNTECSKP